MTQSSVLTPQHSPLRALVATTFLIYFGWGVIAPILPLFGRELGAGAGLIGVLVAAFSVASFCFDVVGGRVADRVGARGAAVGGAALVAASSVLSGVAPNLWILLIGRLLAGAGSAFYVTSAMSVIARTTAPERMGRSMSIYQGAILSGVAIGPAVGGLLSEAAGLRPPFFVYGVAALACVVVAWRALPARLPAPASAGAGGAAMRRLLRDGAFLTALAIAFAVFVVRTGVTSTTVPLYADEELDLSRALVGLALTVSALTNLAWLPSAGRLADRRPRRVATLVGLLCALAGVLLLAAGTGVPGLYAAMLLTGASTAFAGVTPAAIISDVAPPAQSGAALGVYRMAVDGASVLAPLAAGLIAGAAGYRAVFLAFALPLVMVLMAVVRLRDTRRVTSSASLAQPDNV